MTPASDQDAPVVPTTTTTKTTWHSQNGTKGLCVLEFYSGIGGMHFGLLEAHAKAQQQHDTTQPTASTSSATTSTPRILPMPHVVAAFDIHDGANRTYAQSFHDHGIRRLTTRPVARNLSALTADDLTRRYGHVDLWLLSPPCQPYTAQKTALQRGAADRRASSFRHLLHHVLPALVATDMAPSGLFVENVPGFQRSTTRLEMIMLLRNLGYVTEEYVVSPCQYGIPHSRRRYYMLARRGGFGTEQVADQIYHVPPAIAHAKEQDSNNSEHGRYGDPSVTHSLERYIDPRCDAAMHLRVPPATLARYRGVFVTRDSRKSCCFTKSYTVYAEGCGSILWCQDSKPDQRTSVTGQAAPVKEEEGFYRYFSPHEVAALMGFPLSDAAPQEIGTTISTHDGVHRPTLIFHPDAGPKAMYKLLGNSVHVTVVADLLLRLIDPSHHHRCRTVPVSLEMAGALSR